MPKKTIITNTRAAGPDHQVVTTVSPSKEGLRTYRRKPCSDCPWRKDAVGEFPAEAFVHSAGTAYDMAEQTFACHQSGVNKPAVCAGFLLRGADHNMSVRIGHITGAIQDDVSDDGIELFDSYRDMAVANGVDPEDEALKPCRD